MAFTIISAEYRSRFCAVAGALVAALTSFGTIRRWEDPASGYTAPEGVSEWMGRNSSEFSLRSFLIVSEIPNMTPRHSGAG